MVQMHVPFISNQTFVMSTASICGTAGLPLPSGERVGVRGNQPLDRKPPHPTPLPCGEREQAVLAAYPWLHSTETCSSCGLAARKTHRHLSACSSKTHRFRARLFARDSMCHRSREPPLHLCPELIGLIG